MKRVRRTPLNKSLSTHNADGTPWGPEHRLDLDLLKERLRWSFEYHLEEYAQRLKEIGGLGSGGTELTYAPYFIKSAKTNDQLIAMALESSITATWEEASWCYVYGNYRAAIVLSAALLEITLKYELYRKGRKRQSGTLGKIIENCHKQEIINNDIKRLANSIKQRRNDVMHANIQIDRPESLLSHTGDEHETEPLTDLSRNITHGWMIGDGETIETSFDKGQAQHSRVHIFRRAARANLIEVREILEFFYSPIPRTDNT